MPLPDYRIRVELEDVELPVWRLLRVPGSLAFSELHVVLQAAMGWEDRHRYRFELGDEVFVDPRLMEDDPWGALDARRQGLADVDPHGGDELRYVYDFGDDWSHRIRIEEVDHGADADPTEETARCLDGAGRCPPEDCGGPPGYRRMLEALEDPSHPERRRWLRHAGPHFDPGAFSTLAANAALTGLFESGGRLAGGETAPADDRAPRSDPDPGLGSADPDPAGETRRLEPDVAAALDEVLERLDARDGAEARVDGAVRSVAEDLLLLLVEENPDALPRARKAGTWSAGALHAAFMELRPWRSADERMTLDELADLFDVSAGSVSRRSRELREAAGDVQFLPFPAGTDPGPVLEWLLQRLDEGGGAGGPGTEGPEGSG